MIRKKRRRGAKEDVIFPGWVVKKSQRTFGLEQKGIWSWGGGRDFVLLSCAISLCYLGVRNPVTVFWHCFFLYVIFLRVNISSMICIVDAALYTKTSSTLFIDMVKWIVRNRSQHRSGQWTQMLGPVSGRWSCECIPQIVQRRREKRHKLNEMSGRSQKKALPKTVSPTRCLRKTYEINCSSRSQKKIV